MDSNDPNSQEALTFQYKGYTVTQVKDDHGFRYECNGRTFDSIYYLELYVDPKCVASKKKGKKRAGRRNNKKRTK